MCVQFRPIPRDTIDLIIKDIEANHPVNLLPDWPARSLEPRSAFPQSEVGLIVRDDTFPHESKMVSVLKSWGYPVSWSKQPIINTRTDSATDPSKMWFESVHERRCIIPTFGFFEAHKSETAISTRSGKPIKQLYLFEALDSPVTFIAGIYEGDRFSMMTTNPNAYMSSFHHRMPVVLQQAELKTWLFGNFDSLFDRKEIALDATKI